MIRIPTHVQRSRHGIWFFRIVVPRNIRKALDGRGEIKKSLGTRDMRQALLAARPLALGAYELFARVEAAMSRQPTPEDVLANAKNRGIHELKSTTSVTMRDGTVRSVTVEEEDTADPAKLAAFMAFDKAKKAELEADVARYVEKPVGVPEAMAEYQKREAEEMARFKAELAAKPSAALARADDESPLFKPDAENVISLRWEEYVLRSEGNNWTAGRTTDAFKAMFNEFMAWWGKDIDIRFINRSLINRFIVYLQTARPIMSGKRKGQKGLNVRTVDNYTTVINGFMMWAQEKGYFPDTIRLPTAKQALVKKATRVKRAEKANPPYSKTQLLKLFNADVYKFDLAHHFWPPLISLFSGARRREIAQLLTSDFIVVDGIPAYSIDILDDENKSVKSEAAKRLIPVHPELIAIGLLDYVQDVRALNLGPELFPGIGVNKYGEKGNAIGNAWRRHREKLGVAADHSPTFHSFRSSALKVLKANGVSFEMRCQLAGHDMNHTSTDYDNTPIPVKELMELGIPGYRYDGLDLSKIRYERKQFDQSNIEGEEKVVISEKKIADARAAKAAAEQDGDVKASPPAPPAADKKLSSKRR